METGLDKSILIVEDNDAHAHLIRRYVETQPSVGRIDRVSNGKAALDYLFEAVPQTYIRPDLILLDLRLPRVSGLEVLKEIKSSLELRSIPVVVLTTSNAKTDAMMAYQLHANGYLVKPVDASRMAEMLETVIRYWLVFNHSLEQPDADGHAA